LRVYCAGLISSPHTLSEPHRYDFYVLTRTDITFKPAFGELLLRLPLNFSTLLTLSQEPNGAVNDVWFCLPHALRPQVEAFLFTGTPTRPGIIHIGNSNGKHAHTIHLFDKKRLPVELLDSAIANRVEAANLYYWLGEDFSRQVRVFAFVHLYWRLKWLGLRFRSVVNEWLSLVAT
jgi:hypothetical protein